MDSDKGNNGPVADPDPDPLNSSVHDSSLPQSSTETSIQVKENDTTTPKHQPGFIFMCNSVTKPTCFRYRVFGLPLSKKDVVEKIKPGTKLFLFDVELKLLYGIYEATSNGEVDLEPAAFGGKFPAQVKFRIFESSLPLPEKSFRRAIVEKYQGSKFSPELNEVQVKKLQLLFRPLSASSSAPAMLPPKIEDQLTPQPRPEPVHQSYVQRVIGPEPVHQSYVQRVIGPEPVQQSYARRVIEHQPRAVAAQTRSNPIEQYHHVSFQPPTKNEASFVQYQQPGLALASGAAASIGQSYYTQQFSSGGHSMIVQDPLRRQIGVEDIRSEGDYQRLLQQNAFQHQTKYALNGQTVAPSYNYHPTLQHQQQLPLAPETIYSGENFQHQSQTKYALNGQTPEALYNYHPTQQQQQQQPPHAPEAIYNYHHTLQQQQPHAPEAIYNYHHTLQQQQQQQPPHAPEAIYNYHHTLQQQQQRPPHAPEAIYNYHPTLQQQQQQQQQPPHAPEAIYNYHHTLEQQQQPQHAPEAIYSGESNPAYYPVPSMPSSAVAEASHSVYTDPYAVPAYYPADPYGVVAGGYPAATSNPPYILSGEANNTQYSDGTGTMYVLSTTTEQPQIATSAMPEQTVLTGSSYSQQI